MIARFLTPCVLALTAYLPVRADDAPAVPGPGFPGDRYASLWTASPFSIPTPEASAALADYQLVGLVQFGGIAYASLVDRRTQEHFVLTSDKPARNLTLVSVAHGPASTSVVINRNGELINLKQEEMSAVVSVGTAPAAAPTANTPSGVLPAETPPARPLVRFHHRTLIIPPPPPQ